MTIIVASWGNGNVLAIDDETEEVSARAGPDVATVLDSLREPCRRWTDGDTVVYTEPGDQRHVRNVLERIPGAIVTAGD